MVPVSYVCLLAEVLFCVCNMRRASDWNCCCHCGGVAEKLFARLLVEDQRAGHLRNQFVNQKGQVIVCNDDDD